MGFSRQEDWSGVPLPSPTQSPTTEQTLVSFNQPPPQYLSAGQVLLDVFQPNPTQCLEAGWVCLSIFQLPTLHQYEGGIGNWQDRSSDRYFQEPILLI